MIPVTVERSLEQRGVVVGGQFSISIDDQAHVMKILRDTMYSDRILAVLREYSSNAWDAHRQSGKATVPIDVTLPTVEEPTLTIRDFGPGLSRHDVLEVYTKYGASTKRASNDAVGMLGIGSKSGFAYADSFTVVSCHGGTRSTYVAALDASDRGIMSLLHEEPCDDETGISIVIAVRAADIGAFHERAQKFFRFFDPPPKINTNLPPLESVLICCERGTLLSRAMYSNDSAWHAIMGCVPYKIDMSQLKGVPKFMASSNGIVRLEIGEAEVNAAREGLKYGPETIASLEARLQSIAEEYVRRTLEDLEKPDVSDWTKRLRLVSLSGMGLPIPPGYKGWDSAAIELIDVGSYGVQPKTSAPRSFTMYNIGRRVKKQSERYLRVGQSTRIVFKDDNRALAGYDVRSSDLVVHPVAGSQGKPAWHDLKMLLEERRATGVPIVRASTMEWTSQRVPRPTTMAPKKAVLVYRGTNDTPASKNWTEALCSMSSSDVFVRVFAFRGTDVDRDFRSLYARDSAVLEILGETMPPIYGWKVKDDGSSVEKGAPNGIPYKTWREAKLKSLFDLPKLAALIKGWSDAEARGELQGHDPKGMSSTLGPDHPLTKFFTSKGASASPVPYQIGELAKRPEAKRFLGDAAERLEEFKQRYQLLTVSYLKFGELCSGRASSAHWVRYVHAIDALVEREAQEKRREEEGKAA